MPRTFGSLSAYEPGLMDKARWWLQDALTPVMGGDARRSGDFVQNKVMPTAEYLPGVGDAMAAGEAVDYFKQGQPIFGTLAAAGAMAGLVPGVGDAVQKGVKKGIRAYHGSPHDFDKFSLDKIGTGEGAQAYGHGLYFAESEGVAKSYRDALAPAPELDDVIGQAHALVRDMGGNKRLAAETLRMTVDRGSPRYEFTQQMADAIESGKIDDFKPKGRMYEVNINANPDDFLDWDKPLSEQSDAAKRALAKATAPNMSEADALARLERYAQNKAPLGAQLKNLGFANEGNIRAETADQLKQQGIPGIKYLDAGSRITGEGTKNYVVFDDALIEILRKYGLAGLGIGAGAGGFGSLAPQDENYQPPVL